MNWDELRQKDAMTEGQKYKKRQKTIKRTQKVFRWAPINKDELRQKDKILKDKKRTQKAMR